MTASPILCVDTPVPLELEGLASKCASAVRPDNEQLLLEAAGQPRRFWQPGSVLRVRFLDCPELAESVMRPARAWTEYADLTFEVVPDGEAEIRVSFADDGNWSALGTDALVPQLFPPNLPTMCLGDVPYAGSSMRVDRLARHEFGHAIGLVHEHSSPASGMRWNREAVIRELSGPPNNWDIETIELNVLQRYSRTTTNFTEFDPDSVMLYAFPPEWTRDGSSYPENHALSSLDRAFAQATYPGRA